MKPTFVYGAVLLGRTTLSGARGPRIQARIREVCKYQVRDARYAKGGRCYVALKLCRSNNLGG